MVLRAGELSAILLNNLFGHEWVGILLSFCWSCGLACGRLLSSNLAMAPNIPIVSSGPNFSYLSSSHPFIYLFSHPLSFAHSLFHFSSCSFIHLSIFPLSHSPTPPLSHSSTLSPSHSSTLSPSHSSILPPHPLVQLSTHPLAHLSTFPLLLNLSSCTFAGEESSPRSMA